MLAIYVPMWVALPVGFVALGITLTVLYWVGLLAFAAIHGIVSLFRRPARR